MNNLLSLYEQALELGNQQQQMQQQQSPLVLQELSMNISGGGAGGGMVGVVRGGGGAGAIDVAPAPPLVMPVDRPLDQLETLTKRLAKRTAMFGGGTGGAGGAAKTHVQANQLLAARGIDTQRLRHLIETIRVTQAFEPLDELLDTDVDGYLQNQHELALIRTIEAARAETSQEASKQRRRQVSSSWRQCKRHILEAVSSQRLLASDGNKQDMSMDFAATSAGQQRGAQPGIPAALNEVALRRMLAYADAWKRTNAARLQNKPVAVFSSMRRCLAELNDPRMKPLMDGYELLAYLLGEKEQLQQLRPGVAANGAREGQYLSVLAGGDHDATLRRQILAGGRSWLEHYFRQYLDRAAARLMDARAGVTGAQPFSPPTSQQQRKLPLTTRLHMWVTETLMPRASSAQWEIVDGHPLWLMVFYFMRSGAYQDALMFATKYSGYLSRTEPKFIEYLTAWVSSPEHDLPEKLRQDLLADFNGRIREGALRGSASQPQFQPRSGFFQPTGTSMINNSPVDPYKYLVFRLVGRITDDLSVPKPVITNLAGGILGWEDDIWIQLMLVRESTSPVSIAGSRSYTLKDCFNKYLGKTSVDEWTSQGQHPMRYFFLLALCGQFERAAAYLWLTQHQFAEQVDAVHYALGLVFYGCLAVSREDRLDVDILSTTSIDTNARPQLDVVRMVQQYTGNFLSRSVYPQEAMQYAFVLPCAERASTTGDHFTQSAIDLVVEIVLDSGEVDFFFGVLDEDSAKGGLVRQAGYLDLYLPLLRLTGWGDMRERLITPAARLAETRAAQNAEMSPVGGIDEALADVELNETAAIALYNLAEQYDKVLDLLARRVCSHLSRRSLIPVMRYVHGNYQRNHHQHVASAAQQPEDTHIHQWLEEDVGRLQKLEGVVGSVLGFYDREWIARRIGRQIRRTVTKLLALIQIFIGIDFLIAELAAPPGSSFGERADWSRILVAIENLGVLPGYDADYATVSAQAEHLRRDYSDLVLMHLPDLFLGAQAVLVIGWSGMRRDASAERIQLAKRSRQWQTFVALVHRWFKIPPETRQLLMDLDEVITTEI